jgi:hypothetical protein
MLTSNRKAMKKIIYLLLIFTLGMFFSSCEKDILDKTPLDQISDPDFWNTETDLELYVNSLYNVLLSWTGGGGGADPCKDLGTDVVIEHTNWWGDHYTYQLDGTLSVPASGGGWDWEDVRRVNYFLENADRATGTGVDHYIGEGYFFRAYIYASLLEQFGELPIITKVLNVDDEELYSARRPRSEVVDFILEDLDMAISKMGTANEAGPNRVHKDVARLFKARICLYEGTWEKYHSGTIFAGSTDGTAYLQEAAAQALAVIETGTYPLHSTENPDQDYYDLFVEMDLSGNPEVLLWRDYDALGLGVANTIWNWPNNQGVTQWMIENYLCTDGLPTAVSPLFVGQDSLSVVEINRDPRLENTIMVPGELDYVALSGDSVKFNVPNVGVNGTPTGYEFEKWRTHWLDPAQNGRTRDVPFIQFRSAEALLIYAEARAELGVLTQADVDMTINKLRDRVGMPHLVIASITVDPNWPDYGYIIPDYLYEIRRERVVELFGEGFRMNDLMRWRAHALFIGKSPKGTMYTDDIAELFPAVTTDENGFIDPYVDYLNGGAYGFNPERDYLKPLPINELTVNTNLEQNPNW